VTGDNGEAQADQYLLGASATELEHLVNQAEVYAEEASQLLERIGIAAGGDVIDVGCGALGILQLLRDRVGPTGRVVGVDREPRMVAAGRQLATERALDIEFIEGDATKLTLPSDSFDFVHCRTLLLNVADPAAVVSELYRIARPGAVVAVEEPDAASWVCDPPHAGFDMLRDALVAAYAASGKDFNIGRRVRRLLRAVGLQDVAVRPTAKMTTSSDYYQTFLLTLTSLVRDQILAQGQLSADVFGKTTDDLRAHLADRDTITCQPMMWQAWGTKP